MGSVAKRTKRRMAAKARTESQPAPREIPGWARVINRVFARLPLWLRTRILRLKYAIVTAVVNPTVPPNEIGLHPRYGYAPASIQLGFKLHADGHVVFRNRWGRDEVVTDDHLIGLVHREYRRLVEEARKQHSNP